MSEFYTFTDLPEANARELGAIYVIKWGSSYFIVQVTSPDKSVTPIAQYDHRPEIVTAVYTQYPLYQYSKCHALES